MKSSRNPNKSLWLVLLALMLAFVFETAAWWWASQTARATSLQGPIWLGLGAALCGLAAAALLWRQLGAATRATRRARQLLASSLDTLDVGLEIWDEHDRLVLYNKKINLIYKGFHTPADIGQTFEALMRAKLKRQLIPAAIGCEQEWLAQRLASRGTHKAHTLKELTRNQWVNFYETRTSEGYLVAAWVDVTELVLKGKVLEANNQRLAQQTAMDGLTGLANRRRFDEALTVEWQRAARGGTPLSLLMVDIDHFKNYNDNYGHLAGDQCLRRVSSVLSRCVRRAGELVARYGGEEFVLLLPGADMAHACEIAQMCLDLMQQECVAHAASPTSVHVTLSIGVACALPDAMLDDPASLVNAADAAMYRAKSSGRAHYEVADQADWEIDDNTPRTQPSPLS
ncbi:diguanylate cyclase domain-containing protein [Rhodoferax ferrireducens]|uniref:GGDEF domain-containing protein n=1 Tax=Rhodoferax ferrireducens TaxID=192843 RepID=UPI003BB711D9